MNAKANRTVFTTAGSRSTVTPQSEASSISKDAGAWTTPDLVLLFQIQLGED